MMIKRIFDVLRVIQGKLKPKGSCIVGNRKITEWAAVQGNN